MSKVARNKLPLAGNDRRWASARVSSRSRFGDDLWVLDIQTAGTRADQRWVDWNIALPPGALITQADLGALIAMAKRFLWTMATDPPPGRKRSSATTLKIRARILQTLILWMAAEGIPRFAEIDRWAVGRFTTWLRGRPGRRAGALTPNTIVSYMVVLKDLYRQRAKLDDAPLVDPLPLETSYEAAGVTRENKGRSRSFPTPSRSTCCPKRSAGSRSMATQSTPRRLCAGRPERPPARRGAGSRRRAMCGMRCAGRRSWIQWAGRSMELMSSGRPQCIWWKLASSSSPASSA